MLSLASPFAVILLTCSWIISIAPPGSTPLASERCSAIVEPFANSPYSDTNAVIPGNSMWLSKHPEVTRYSIIDDEDDELDHLPLFQPSCKTGITAHIVKGVHKDLSGRTDHTMRANLLVRAGQNIHSLFKRDKS